MKQMIQPKQHQLCFITLGCAKNEVDTAAMKEAVLAAGYSVCEDPEMANVIIVNTCSFIQSATEESLDAIFELADLPQVLKGNTHIVVAGCMVSRYGDDLKTELNEAAAFVACKDETHIVSVVEQLIGKPVDAHQVDAAIPCAPSTYVKISDGCDRFCSYCTIPYIRGRYHSFDYETIVYDVEKAARLGAREIVLIAQDTGRWGQDLLPERTLAWLLDNLAKSYPQLWFRVMYLQPEGLSDELLSVFAQHDNICKYFDIPLQHVNPTILKSMNRSGSYDEYVALVERIRAAIPQVCLRTTLIAGFPGETDEQFEELCDFVGEGFFDYVGVFAYSQEDGTRAAQLPNQIDEDEKQRRTQIIRDLADSISVQLVAERVGKTFDVLVEGIEEDGQLVGRAMCQAPEVDGVVYLNSGEIGQIVSATITDTLLYEMEGEVQ